MIASPSHVKGKTIHFTIVSCDFTAVSVPREVLRIYIVDKNLTVTHFSASRHDRMVL